jgi:dienelactone hydrolase
MAISPMARTAGTVPRCWQGHTREARVTDPSSTGPAVLSDFTARQVTVDGATKTVYTAGAGPAVILMPEMPGISPDLVRFAGWIRDAGFTVYLPSLFGTDGAYPDAAEGAAVTRRTCVSAEFRAFGGGGTSPVVSWLRGLARTAHQDCGGRGWGLSGSASPATSP